MGLQPTKECRFPVLTSEGEELLRKLQEHPHAPVFRNGSGHRLHAPEIEQAREFHRTEIDAPTCVEREPDWLPAYLEHLRRDVPFFRIWPHRPFKDLPTTSRADLSRDISAYVPDNVPLERLLHFETTGTTGHRISIPSYPIVTSRHLAFLRKALKWHGIELKAGQGELGVALCGFQEECFTYASVNPLFDEAGLVKINLHPSDWKDPKDRAAYLDAWHPELVTGDPISLPELVTIGMQHKPRAALSTSMSLSEGLRLELEEKLGCPVVDVYSLNESGPVAAKIPGRSAFKLLQSHLVVELLDEDGIEAPDGERGEITLTGGFNDWLPLLRYRTGDWARRDPQHRDLLYDLEGRLPVRFLDGAGNWVNNIEISRGLSSFALSRFQLHQENDGRLLLSLPLVCPDRSLIKNCVEDILKRPVVLSEIKSQDKVIAYSSEMYSL